MQAQNQEAESRDHRIKACPRCLDSYDCGSCLSSFWKAVTLQSSGRALSPQEEKKGNSKWEIARTCWNPQKPQGPSEWAEPQVSPPRPGRDCGCLEKAGVLPTKRHTPSWPGCWGARASHGESRAVGRSAASHQQKASRAEVPGKHHNRAVVSPLPSSSCTCSFYVPPKKGT